MTPPPIRLIRAAGSHTDVGRQIGAATAAGMRRLVEETAFDPALVARYRAVTLEHVPWIVEELDGAADGAGLDPLAVFAASIEELAPAEAPTGCSDLVVTGARTADGHLLVAHTNDLYAEDEDEIVAIEWRVPGEPTVLTLGSGPWISVGWNDAGLSVTGNEVSPNDERVGIPRLLQVRDVLTRRTLREALDASLHPARSSAYNWVLAHADGSAANVEASATSAGIDEPGENGFLAHTNHYAREDMRRFEQAGDYESSCKRLDRARRLGAADGFTVERLREVLSDHENGGNSICRHGDEPKDVKTVFWCVADVTAGEITYGRGNPCDSEAQVYRFLIAASLFAKPLPEGGTIGVAAPASPYESRSDLFRGVEWWESQGYRVKLAAHVLARDDFVAGDARDRAADLVSLFADPEVDAIQCLQGGYGSAQVIPYLDFEAIAANPKPFIGFSDITALHVAIRQRTGLATFYGNGLLGVGDPETTAFSKERLLEVLRGKGAGETPKNPDDPYTRPIRGGKITAPLVGGCLWLLMQTLGTPWEIDLDGAIFFFEDYYLPPYQADGILTQLAHAGKLAGVRGVVVGDMEKCDWGDHPRGWPRTRSIEDVLEVHLEPLGVPVLYKLPLGHGKHLATIPLGVTATLDADARTLTIEQSGLAKGEKGE